MRKMILVLVIFVIACAGPAAANWRNYEVSIQTVEDVVLGMDQTVGITIEPIGDPADDLIPMAILDLTIAYDADHLVFNGARKGSMLESCGWEYFTVQELPGYVAPCSADGPQMKLIHIAAVADVANGPSHPSCITADELTTLVEMGFSVVGQQLSGDTYLPIQFYWPDDDYPDGCNVNSFTHTDLTHSFVAANVYDHLGQPYDAAYDCAGQDPACDNWEFGWQNIDFRSGGMTTHLALRGDVSWNSLPFEISDYVVFTRYWIYGLSAFTHNVGGQIMSTDINCDGYTLSVADYITFGSIFFGAPEWPCPGDGFGKSVPVTGSVSLFAEGRSGMTSLPVEVFVANDANVGGLQARFEYDPAYLTPVIDEDCYYCTDGISVAHEVVGRAWDIYNTGTIRVINPEPGAVVVRFVPGDSRTPLATGDDMVLRIHFDVAAGLLPDDTSPLTLVAMDYDYNEFASVSGEACDPELLASTFTVTSDELAYNGGDAERGDVNVPLSFDLTNDDDLVGLTSRIVYDTDGLTPHFLTGENVRYVLIGRGTGYDNLGAVSVTSSTPGEVLINFTPPETGTMPLVAAGTGAFIRVYFDAADGILPFPPHFSVDFVDGENQRNELLTASGHSVFPNLTGGIFEVTLSPVNPSCPVLFVHDGEQFIQENPLLTACEKNGYTEAVTDFYRVNTKAESSDGRLHFQLRELEDEITHLQEVELITVDHAEDTQVACTADGEIHTYRSVAAPISAIDHNGVDRLAEVIDDDGLLFKSDGPGHLIVTFADNTNETEANGSGDVFQISSIAKRRCELNPELLLKDGDTPVHVDYPTIEVKDAQGAWVPLPGLPPRESAVDEYVTADQQILRISWSRGYQTDVISRLVPAEEQPVILHWAMEEYQAISAEGEHRKFASVEGRRVLELVKGDVFDFSFASGEEPATGMQRDLIIRAVGKYRPDYDVFTNMLPSAPRLGDAYPNPFNPVTTIMYELHADTHVKLEIFDVAGRLVTTLVDQQEGPGPHSVKWMGVGNTGERVASGTYFYYLTTGETRLAKKMVLMK